MCVGPPWQRLLARSPPHAAQLKTHSEVAEGDDLVMTPALDSHVFCKVLEDVGLVKLQG